MSEPARFDFSALPRPDGYRRTYSGTLDAFRRGLLSVGFLWDLADYDEVFAARLRREGIADCRATAIRSLNTGEKQS